MRAFATAWIIGLATATLSLAGATLLHAATPDASTPEAVIPDAGAGAGASAGDIERVIERSVPTSGEKARISMSPLRFSTQVARPGDVLHYRYFIRNYTDEPVTLYTSAMPLAAASTPESLVQPAHTEKGMGAAAGWTTLPFNVWKDLAPGRELEAVAQVRVPTDAVSGVYAMAIAATQRITTGGSNLESSARVNVDSVVASQAIITVPGNLERAAKLRDITSPRIVWGSRMPTFEVTATNTGTAILDFDAQVELSSLMRIASRRIGADGPSQQALPGGTREFTVRWSDRPLLGWFTPRLTVVGGAGSNLRLERPLPRVYVLPPWRLVLAVIVATWLPIKLTRRARRQALERGELVGRARWTARRRARRRARRHRRRESHGRRRR